MQTFSLSVDVCCNN